jgi:hypothetical protein
MELPDCFCWQSSLALGVRASGPMKADNYRGMTVDLGGGTRERRGSPPLGCSP